MQQEPNSDSNRELQKHWNAIHKALFGSKIPWEKEWLDPIDILYVLNQIARYPTSNQIYTPEGRWSNLRKSHVNPEPGYIELGFTEPKLVKPDSLVFHSFGSGTKWNYFALVTQKLTPTGLYPAEYYEEKGRYAESVYQATSLGYVAPETSEADQVQIEHKESMQHFYRYYNGGDFVIGSPASPLNQITLRDETLHERLGTHGFRAFIHQQVDKENKAKQ